MDNAAFNRSLGRAKRGETEAVFEACRQHQGLMLRADVDGDRLLHRACDGGHLELARGLLDLGAVVDARNNYGWDALMYASRNGYPAVVTLLLDRGADPCSRNDDYTALYLAAMYDHLQVCLILLNRGADLMAVGHDGRTALTHYGFYANPRLSNEIKEQRREQLRVAWAAGLHPSQVQRRRDERWARRYPLMNVLTGNGFRPLAARRLQLEMERLALGSEMPPPEPLDTPQKLHAHLLGQVLSNAGLVRSIVSYL